MDKYEFNIKVEQIKKNVKAEDYETAQKICDGIDWRRVSSVSLLSMVSEIYEKNGDFDEAKDILLMAYERAPIGKRLLYKLCMLALRQNNINEAEQYYREFYDLAPDDPRQHLLRYSILRAKGAPAAQLINSLETYTETELDERYMYELAELYYRVGNPEAAVRMCDKVILMFGIGSYVDRAKQLKSIIEGVPLEEYTQETVVETPPVAVHEAEESATADFPAKAGEIVDVEAEVVDDRSSEKPAITPAPQEIQDTQAAQTETAAAEPAAKEENKQRYTVNFIVERKTPEAGFESAKRLLKLMHEHTGSTNSVTKIKAGKLNERGLDSASEKIAGKDLIIEEAGDLTESTIEQIENLIRREPDKRIIVLIDNPMQLKNICNRHPELFNYFHMDKDDEAEYVPKHSEPQTRMEKREDYTPAPEKVTEEQREDRKPEIRSAERKPQIPQMSIDEFAQTCAKYANSIDCSISGKSMLALYERIEIMEEDGIPLTEQNAINLIEEAADRAEKKSLGNLFAKKYDKNDMLILREEHFLP